MGWVQVTPSVTLSNITPFDTNIDKFIVRLHYLRIFFILANFQGNQRLIAMSSINC